MSKETIPDDIQTITIPFISVEWITPANKIFKDTVKYFRDNFTNADDFEPVRLENTYWVIIDDEWCELGNNIIFERKAAPSPEVK